MQTFSIGESGGQIRESHIKGKEIIDWPEKGTRNHGRLVNHRKS